MEIKIRYTFKRKSDGFIRQEIVPLELLESGSKWPVVLDTHTDLWEVIGRDLWTGHESLFGGDIVRIPNYETTWKNEEPKFDWRVFEIKWNGYTWAFSNESIYLPFSTYNTHTLEPYQIEKVGCIYTSPELLEKQN